jgi:hypothetical protein
MGKVSYTAYNASHQSVSGYINAQNNKEAMEKLKAMGFTEITLHGDALFGAVRDDLEGLSQSALERIAKFEAESHKTPGFLTSLIHLLHTYKIALILASLLIVWGVASHSTWSWGLGVFAISAIVLPWAYSYRNIWTFEELHRMMAFGEMARALPLIEGMQKRLKGKPQIIFQLDKFRAYILACEGEKDQALALIAPHKEHIDEIMPGAYESTVSSIHYITGAYEDFINSTEMVYASDPNNTNFALDLAFAYARFGNTAAAKTLMNDKVDPALIPSYAAGIYDWTLGLIAHEEGQLKSAQKHYEIMTSKFEPYINNPLIWEMIADATGYYADLLHDAGYASQGKALLQPGTVRILNVHINDSLREKLSRKYPSLISKRPWCLRKG